MNTCAYSLRQPSAPSAARKRLAQQWTVTSLIFVGGSLSAMASELVMTDVKLGIDSLPTSFDYTIRDAGNTRSGSSEFDLGFGLGARAVYAFSSPGSNSAFFVGGELALGAYRYGQGGTYGIGMARAIVGYGYAFNDQWTAEIAPWYGYGQGQLHIPGSGVSADYTVNGSVIDYGARLGMTYALSNAWLINAHVGWMVSSADLQGDGLEIELTQSGPTVFLGFIYRFGGAPPSIR